MIETYQSERPNVGVIYSGTVEHLLGVIGRRNWWLLWQPSDHQAIRRRNIKKTEDGASDRYADFKHIVRRFFDELIADPSEFISRYGADGRDIYAAKELNNYFCEWYGVDGNYKCMLSELCPHEYFSAQGEMLNVKAKGKYLFFHKGIALRNADKWIGESAANCRTHIRDSMINRGEA